MKNIFIISILFTTLLFSCESIEDGYVIDKKHIPAVTITTPVYNSSLKTTILQTHHYPESFKITFEKEVDYEFHKRSISVTEEYYNDIDLGDYISIKEENERH